MKIIKILGCALCLVIAGSQLYGMSLSVHFWQGFAHLLGASGFMLWFYQIKESL